MHTQNSIFSKTRILDVVVFFPWYMGELLQFIFRKVQLKPGGDGIEHTTRCLFAGGSAVAMANEARQFEEAALLRGRSTSRA